MTLLMFSGQIAAQQPMSQTQLANTVSEAITLFHQTKRKEWAFNVFDYENEEGDIRQSTERFDPSNAPNKQWTLLTINGGQTPTEKQRQAYLKEKNKPKSDEDNRFKLKLNDLIQLNSLTLIENKKDYFNASFAVNLKQMSEKANESLTGLLTYNKKEGYISQIEITNKDIFSPVLTAKIDAFNLLFTFIKLGDAILPSEKHLTMHGTFAFFTEIDEVSTTKFSNYVHLGLKE